MSTDMLIRKKTLKVQERLGMRIGIVGGTSRIPTVKNVNQVMDVLRELYRIGLKAFVLPKELFNSVKTAQDIYTKEYGNLLKIRDMAQKYNIELAIEHTVLNDQPDEELKKYGSIASVIDCRSFMINPSFYSKMMPKDQALKLAVYKINEIISGLRTSVPLGVQTTGKVDHVGDIDEVLDFVKRTQGTEPVINWAHLHSRGMGDLRSQRDFERYLAQIQSSIGPGWFENAYFFFEGAAYGSTGMTRTIPIHRSDMNLEHLIKALMSYGIKGTLILNDPSKDKFILDSLDDLADMVR